MKLVGRTKRSGCGTPTMRSSRAPSTYGSRSRWSADVFERFSPVHDDLACDSSVVQPRCLRVRRLRRRTDVEVALRRRRSRWSRSSPTRAADRSARSGGRDARSGSRCRSSTERAAAPRTQHADARATRRRSWTGCSRTSNGSGTTRNGTSRISSERGERTQAARRADEREPSPTLGCCQYGTRAAPRAWSRTSRASRPAACRRAPRGSGTIAAITGGDDADARHRRPRARAGRPARPFRRRGRTTRADVRARSSCPSTDGIARNNDVERRMLGGRHRDAVRIRRTAR